MQFRVLGCGTSTGVPVAGCLCAVCKSTNPKNERLRTAAQIITDNSETILIDAGLDLRLQCLRHNILDVSAVLFTHAHSDHILGVDDLRGFNFVHRRPIPCYGNDKTLSEIERIFGYLFGQDTDYEGGMLTNLELQRIQELKPFSVLGETITPFLLYHGKVPVIGYRIRDLVYATDCNKIPNESKEIMRNAKILFLDGLRFRPHKTHFTIEESLAVAHELNAEQTYLIHMSHDVDYEEANSKLPSHIRLAYDGLTVTFT